MDIMIRMEGQVSNDTICFDIPQGAASAIASGDKGLTFESSPRASQNIWNLKAGPSSGERTREREMAMTKAKEIVSSNPVVVFSKSYCPYCVTVNLFAELGATFKAVELDPESYGSEVQSALREWTGQRTVLNVFIGGNHIGGCDTNWYAQARKARPFSDPGWSWSWSCSCW